MSKGLERSNIKNTNVEFYEQFASFYQMHYGRICPSVTVGQWATKLADLGFIPAKTSKFERGKMRLIDIGCGPGAFLLHWAEEGFQVAGLDSSQKMLSLAESHFRTNRPNQACQLIRTDIREITNKSLEQQFDLAVSHFNFLNLFPADRLNAVFQGVWKLLRPGGVWMTDFCEVIGELDGMKMDSFSAYSDECARSSERFFPEEGRFEVRWVVQHLDMIERYWLKNGEAIRRSAEDTGFKIFQPNQKRSLCGELEYGKSKIAINRLITVFEKRSGNGPSEPQNVEDRSHPTGVF